MREGLRVLVSDRGDLVVHQAAHMMHEVMKLRPSGVNWASVDNLRPFMRKFVVDAPFTQSFPLMGGLESEDYKSDEARVKEVARRIKQTVKTDEIAGLDSFVEELISYGRGLLPDDIKQQVGDHVYDIVFNRLTGPLLGMHWDDIDSDGPGVLIMNFLIKVIL